MSMHQSSHSHSHSHQHLPSRAVPTAPLVRIITVVLLVLIAAGTAIGLALLWPDPAKVELMADRAQITATGMSYEQGEILSLGGACDAQTGAAAGPSTGADDDAGATGTAQSCRLISVGVLSGPDEGRMVEIALRGGLAGAGLEVGDHVELIAYTTAEQPVAQPGGGEERGDAAGAGQAAAGEASYRLAISYDVAGVERNVPLLVLAILFAIVVVAVGRFRGLFALVALGVSAGVLLFFVLPALVAGGPGLLIALVGSSAIMFVTLYFVHGPNMRTTAALIGTLCGIAIMAIISVIAVHTTRLSGVGDEASGLLSTFTTGAAGPTIDFRGLLTCAIIIAGLGILNDVTITQASAVWELRAVAPTMPRREIYARGMRIGRDHLASTVYTVFFAYVGAAMSVLILLYLYNRPMLSLLTREDIAVEIVRTLVGSIGLVLAIPITTAIATLFVPPAADPEPEQPSEPGGRPGSPEPVAPAI